MAKKDPLEFIGTEYANYTVTKYCGKNENDKDMYEIKFKETGNIAIRAKSSLVGGKAVDLKHKMEKTRAKQDMQRKGISKRAQTLTPNSVDVLYGDFDISKNTLVLDQATITSGFVVVKDGSVDTMGFLRQDKNEELAVRIYEMKKEIRKLIDTHDIKNLVLEEIFLGQNLLTYRALCMLIGVLVDLCIEKNISCTLVLASVWREKYGIKGARSACKAKALSIVKVKFGLDLSKQEEDLAEAILIAYYILEQYGKDNMFNWQ